MADISKLPPPPGVTPVSKSTTPQSAGRADISSLPRPDISALPAPPPTLIRDLPPPPPKPKSDLLETRWVRPEEADAIAKEFGSDSKKLQQLAPYFGINLLGSSQPSAAEAAQFGAISAASKAGRAVGVGLGIEYLYRRYGMDPKDRKAIEKLRALSESRKSTLESGTDIATDVAAPAIGLPAKIMKGESLGKSALRVGGAAGVGTVYGAASSDIGKESEGATSGAILGGGLGAGGELLGKVLGRGAKLSKQEQELVRGRQADLTAETERIAERVRNSEQDLEGIVTQHKQTMTPDEVRRVAEEQLGPETLKEYLDPRTERGKQIRDQMEGPTTDREITQELANRVINGRVRDFAESLTGSKPKTGEDALLAIEKHASRQGADATLNSYRNFVNLEHASKAIEELGFVAKDQPGFFGTTLNKISDNQYVLRHLDDKYGTSSEAALRELNRARNRLTFARQGTRQGLEDIFQTARKNGTDKVITNSDRIYQALDTGNSAGLSPQEIQTAQSFRKYFSDVRDYANGLVKQKDPSIAPLSIPKRENYVPHQAIRVQEQIPLINDRIRQAEQELRRPLNGLSDKELEVASKSIGPIKDLVDFAKWADNSVSIRNGRDLVTELDRKLHTREGNIALESRARAAMERTGEIPEFIREKNLYKLADSYAHNTLNHLYLRNALEKLRNEGKKLDKAGASGESDYVQRIVQDTLGIRKGTAAEGLMQSRIFASGKLDRMIDEVGPRTPTGLALTAVRALPDIGYALMRNIYPNLLGYGNVYAGVQNLITGFTRLAPELGTRYGYATVLRSAVKTSLNFREYYKMAEYLGNVPAEVLRKGEAALAEGIARSRVFNLTAEGYRKLGAFGMKLFETSEKLNRALTIAVADTMAADLARVGTKVGNSALGSLGKFPASIQREIRKDLHNTQKNAELLGQYLNDTTQFNYNRSSLFEFGRTLGPVLSTFSKWPTAVLGEAAYAFRRHGLSGGTLRNAERLLAPFALLYGAQQVLQHSLGADSPEEVPDLAKKFVGSSGLQAMAPLNALHGFATGEIFTPPALDFLMKGVVSPVFAADNEKRTQGLEKGLETALKNYAPGSGLVRFITDDLVTYLTGHKPEGTFLEKTDEGARRLERMVK